MKCYSCQRNVESLNTISYEEQVEILKRERPLAWEIVRSYGARKGYNEGEHRYCVLCMNKEVASLLKLKWEAYAEDVKRCDRSIERADRMREDAIHAKDESLEKMGLIEKADPNAAEKKQ